MNRDLDSLVIDAGKGDRDALDALVRAIQDPVHHLAMRILVDPEEAREATQEILILVVTRLSTFEGRSAFKTWVYRVAVNYLLDSKRVRDRDPGLTFELFEDDLHSGLVAEPEPSGEDRVLLNELRISCTMAMLLCLDLKHRVAFVLGDILEFDHAEAAAVLLISKANFRQRLSRARADVVAFTARSCGLATAEARCRCPRRLPAAIAQGRVRPERPVYARPGAPGYDEVRMQAAALEGALRTLALQRGTPRFGAPEDLAAKLTEIVSLGP